MVLREVGKLSNQLLGKHKEGQQLPCKMEELPRRRSVGDKSLNPGCDGSDTCHSSSKFAGHSGGVPESVHTYSKLWHSTMNGQLGNALDEGEKWRDNTAARRHTSSGLDRLEAIWEGAWESPLAAVEKSDLVQHKGGKIKIVGNLGGKNSLGDRACDRVWAISTACSPALVSGCGHRERGHLASKSLGARVEDGALWSGSPTSLTELPGFRSGEGMDWEDSCAGGSREKEAADLEKLVQLWDEQWLGATNGDRRPAQGGGSQIQGSPSLINRLLKVMTPSKTIKEEASEFSDELRDWLNQVIPPYPPDYVDPASGI